MQEADWKVFRKLIPVIRERYLHKRNVELIALLSAPGKTETERFWDTDEAIRREAEILHVCLDDIRRSRLWEILLLLRGHGLLLDEDLAGFTEETQAKVREFDDDRRTR